MGAWVRAAIPLVLLVLAGLAAFGDRLSGYAAVQRTFGDDAVLRFVVAVLCLVMIVLIGERQRMADQFTEVLRALRDFHRERTASSSADAQRQAVELLIGALESQDPAVRAHAVEHLQRLTGEALGEDPAAWRAWLARQADG